MDAARPAPPRPGGFEIERQLAPLKRRLVHEATLAIRMLEDALAALWTGDVGTATEVLRRDDEVDDQEVAIEQECYRILALYAPVARDFRTIAFVLKVNADIERVADHATGIAKVVRRLRPPVPPLPTALRELGQRVPLMCHTLMRAVLDEDMGSAQQIVSSDETIDELEKRCVDEVLELLHQANGRDAELHNALMLYRVARELERIGDLMASIAEDVVYLSSGEIIRHRVKRAMRLAKQRGDGQA
ncbi:MAG: phosphate signaling complex protein PhoU [Phycisphaerales bacterium]|jgi:phosphate transport system protein|nr:phosphate signaling complex protein PhoU [Phycisphaerales bacterium]